MLTMEEARATQLKYGSRCVRNRAVLEFQAMRRAPASLSGSFLAATR